jgi:DNA-binding GntR family transcriptional regulator
MLRLVSAPRPLPRTSVVETLAEDLRGQILDGELPAGTPLREVELAGGYGVSRHTLRAALRALAAEGIVRIEAHRGARVASLDRAELVDLFELRTALEVEAARLALERHGGRLPAEVHRAVARLGAACERPRPSWRTIAELHAAVHGAIVDASESRRIRAAYGSLAAELALFLLQLRPVWSLERMRTHHEELVRGLEAEGPDVLRRHLRDGAAAVLAGADGVAP